MTEGVDSSRGIFTPELLSRCISCGFCLPACPTYQNTGSEESSPRGRITLMRALESGELELSDATTAEESSFCLGCRACEPVCPAGVQYGALLEQWRDVQWAGRRRPLVARLLTFLVRWSWPIRLIALLRRPARSAPHGGPHLMLGCFERVLFPGVSQSAMRLLPELDANPAQGCCGALHAHNGDSTTGHQLAVSLGERLTGTIVTTSGGCAAHLASVLGRDRVQEISERAVAGPRQLTRDGRPLRVGLQDSCHLRNGLGVWREPRELIAGIAEYVEIPGAQQCCGAAGTYALTRPADSRAVLNPKLDAIIAAGVDVVACVNPGCLRQLQSGLRKRKSPIRAVHLVELLAAVRNAAPDPGGAGNHAS